MVLSWTSLIRNHLETSEVPEYIFHYGTHKLTIGTLYQMNDEQAKRAWVVYAGHKERLSVQVYRREHS